MNTESSTGPERSPSDHDSEHASERATPSNAPQPVKPIPVAVEERSFVSLIPQFFIFPLLLVVIGVMVYVFFIAPAQEERPISDLLTEIHMSYLPQSRNRAAYDLASRAQELEGEGQTMSVEETRQLIEILEKTTDDPKLRGYLVCARGRAGEKSQAYAVLSDLLGKPALELEVKIEAIRGLGLSRNPVALDTLIKQLVDFDGAEDWEPRQITLSALANIALGPNTTPEDRLRVTQVLEKYLQDAHWMVRWNTACILASSFQNTRGFETLRSMLDREYLGEHVEKANDQAPWLVRALGALAACEARDFCGDVEKLRQDSSFPVRNAVLEFQKKLCGDA